MTVSLDEDSRKALVQYRLSRSEECFQEASLLASESHYNAAMNRLYYACYYAVVALLISGNISATTHAGVKTMFNLHYVVNGRLPKSHGKTFSRLFDIRHSGDYDDFVYCDKEMFDEFLPQSKSFVDAIQAIL